MADNTDSKQELLDFITTGKSEVTGALKDVSDTKPEETTTELTDEKKDEVVIDESEKEKVIPEVEKNLDDSALEKETTDKTKFDLKSFLAKNKTKEDKPLEQKEEPKEETKKEPAWKQVFEDEDEYISYKLSKDGSKVTPANIGDLSAKDLAVNKLLDEYKRYGLKEADALKMLAEKYDVEIDDLDDSSYIYMKEAKEAEIYFNTKFDSLKEGLVQDTTITDKTEKTETKVDTVIKPSKEEILNEWGNIASAMVTDSSQTKIKLGTDSFEYALDEEFLKEYPSMVKSLADQYNLDINEENLTKVHKVILDQYYVDHKDVIHDAHIAYEKEKWIAEQEEEGIHPHVNKGTKPKAGEDAAKVELLEWVKEN